MSHQKVILVLGSGANIGRHVARAFTAKGYKVALASRSLKDKESEPGQVHFPIDLSDPASVPNLFSEVTEKLGSPSVVVYNAAAATANDPEDTFSISLNDFIKDLNINTTSPFAAAKAAVSGFSQLPESASKTFIYTGNVLNTDTTIGPLMSLGVGKSATAHMIHSAATVYADRGFRFYYADERKEDGTPASRAISGEAHAKHYVELAEGKEQGPWHQTFVRDQGYKQF